METYFLIRYSHLFLITILLIGCVSQKPTPPPEPLIKSTSVLNDTLKENYRNNMAIVLGRLDGMNDAIVNGLVDLSKSCSKNKSLSKKSLTTALNNKQVIDRLQSQINQIVQHIKNKGDTDDEEDESDSHEETIDVNVDDLFN